MLVCWGDWKIIGMFTWVLKCTKACMLSQSHTCFLSWPSAWMFSCFVDNMLTFILALMITCSYVYMFWRSHAPMFRCFDVHILSWSHIFMIICSHAYMFNDYMPACLYNFILNGLDCLMIICSYVQMFW